MNTVPATLAWCVLQVTLLAAFVAAWCLVLRKSAPASRSLATFTGLALIVALSLVSFSPWPRWSTARLDTVRSASFENPALLSLPNPAHDTAGDAAIADMTQAGPKEGTSATSIPADGPSPASLFWEALVGELQAPAASAADAGWSWPAILSAAVLVGAAIGLARLLAGLILVRSYKARSRAICDRPLIELRDVVQAELQCPQPVELFESERLATAATVGWRKPLVLLPANWREWSDDERRAVLAHEIAHIQRHDFLTWVAAQGALVLHYYHPLVHWLCRRLRLEQELAADAAAARLVGGQQTYLAILAAMALRQSDRPVAWPARAFLPTRGTFLRRIEMLRDTKLGSTTSIGVRVGTVGVLLAAGLAISGLRGGTGPAASAEAAAPVAEAVAVATALGAPASELGLEYVPRDAMLVATLRPGEFLGRPEFAPFVKALREKEYLKQELGIAVDRVEQVMVAMLAWDSTARSPLDLTSVTIRVREAADITAMTKSRFSDWGEQEYGNRKYFKEPRPGGSACYLSIDEQTIVLAPETVLRRVIVAGSTGGATRAKWSAAWGDVGGQPGALLLNTEIVRGLVASRPKLPPFLLPFAPLWKSTDTALVQLNGDEAALQLAGALLCPSAEEAKKVHETLSAVVTLTKNALSQARADAARIPDKTGAALLVAADVADSALDGVNVKQEDRAVRFSTTIPEKDGAILASLLVPAVTNARAAARQAQAKNNLKMIGLAMHNYHDTFKRFPPAAGYAQIGKEKSKHPHSWRVAILPFLEVDQAALYDQYNFDEPWDSENNKEVLAKMPPVFRDPNDPADSTNSSYFVLVGKESGPVARSAAAIGGRIGDSDGLNFGFSEVEVTIGEIFNAGPGTTIMQVTDGTSNTLMVVEAPRDIPWTKPEDIPYAADKPLPKLGGHYPGGFMALFGDGHVDFISEKIDEKTLRAIITMNDGINAKFDQFIIRNGPVGQK